MLNKRTIFFIVIAIFVAILVGNMCYKNCCEGLEVRSNTGGLRANRGTGTPRRRVVSGAGARLGRGRGRGGGGNAHRYMHRRRNRHWAGPDRGYSYGPRRRYFYDNWWPFYSNYYAPTATIATVPLTYGCKSGCVNLGNGEWGCQYPGDGITQCQFAVDCEACDSWVWWRPSTWF